ncbi:MAG TPA: ABC transporter ATP-binding protein [Roseiflexaceae bacterium]|nr:ABC transporter ATP-binding protein [Roseiflexaceae bacterium]
MARPELKTQHSKLRTTKRSSAMVTAAHTADPCLSIRNVSKAFDSARGRVLALRDISLEIRRGEFVSLIGHSGCGKSTLLSIIAGLHQPSAGSVTLDGRPITRPGPDRAVVFQNYSLLPWLSVRDNVFEAVDSVHAGRPRAEKQTLVDEFLRTVGLYEHRDKKPGQISGGMKQRVAIARAFAAHPQVLLLDEPFGALDALTRSTLHEELLRMWSGDMQTETVVMVTHDIDEAIYLSDRIVVMTNGPEATIGEIIPVPLPRPRDKQSLLHTPEWAAIKEHLMGLLTAKSS